LNPEIKNIKLVEKGVGNKPGNFTLVNDRPDNFGMGYVKEDVIDNEACKQQIQIVTLDGFLLPMKLKRIDFIKIDVEGFELNVLFGANDIINKFRPYLFVEVVDEHLRKQGTSAHQLIDYLEKLDYEITNSSNNEIVTKETNFDNMMDVLAIPK